jgi:hypothetical protein
MSWYTRGKTTAPHHQGQIADEGTGATVAITYCDPDGSRAKLIAAAPDLLVACELIREAADDLRLSHPSPQFAAAIALVDAAIAKARGDA